MITARASRCLALAAALFSVACVRQPRAKSVVEQTRPGGAVASRTSMENGRRHGPFQSFYPNGQLATRGFYANGMRHGMFWFFNEDGSVRSRLLYDRDRLVWDSASRVVTSPPEPPPAIAAAPPGRVPIEMGVELGGLAGGNTTAERVDSPLVPSARVGGGGALTAQSSIVVVAFGADYITSDTTLSHLYVGGSLGVRLRAPGHDRLLIKAALEVGGHRFGGLGEGALFEATRASHWMLYRGVRAGLSYPISGRLRISLQLGHRRDRNRDALTLSAGTRVGPTGVETQEWDVGGATTFGLLGLRFALRP